jgi:hypothetical protein
MDGSELRDEEGKFLGHLTELQDERGKGKLTF